MSALPRPFGALVVEDDPGSLLFLTRALRALGVASSPARDATAAVLTLRLSPAEIDCAFVPLRLLEMDGLAAGRLLRGVKPRLPCCLVGGSELLSAGRPEGFRCVLVRPFQIGELEACLAALGWVDARQVGG